MAKSPDEKVTISKLREEDPEEYAANIMAMRTCDHERHGPKHRAMIRLFIEEAIRSFKVRRVRCLRLLGRLRFIVWYKTVHGFTQETIIKV